MPNMTDYQLAPKEGYVEIMLPDGSREYKATPEQEEKEFLLAQNKLKDAQIQALTEQKEFLEDCVAEMATIVYV